jgi:hypothetical protein
VVAGFEDDDRATLAVAFEVEVPTLADVDRAREVSGRWVRCGERRIVGAANYRKQHHRQRKPCHAAPQRSSSSSSYSARVSVGPHGAIVAEPAAVHDHCHCLDESFTAGAILNTGASCR